MQYTYDDRSEHRAFNLLTIISPRYHVSTASARFLEKKITQFFLFLPIQRRKKAVKIPLSSDLWASCFLLFRISTLKGSMLINIPLLERKAIKERVDFFPLPRRKRGRSFETTTSPPVVITEQGQRARPFIRLVTPGAKGLRRLKSSLASTLKPEKSLLNILENIGFRKMERLGFQESCFSLLIRAPFPLSALYIVVVAIKRLWIPWYDTWCYLLGSIYPPWFRSARAILIIML